MRAGQFRCPRCGGVYFGRDVALIRDGVEVRGRFQPGDKIRLGYFNCHSTRRGEAQGRFVVIDGRLAFVGSNALPCRWRGPASECVVTREGAD